VFSVHTIEVFIRNIDTLAKNYTVYAIDLLGFGASDKPEGFSYTMEAWAQVLHYQKLSCLVFYSEHFLTLGKCYPANSVLTVQLILDFLDEVIQKPTVLIGNSVGSLACVIAASGS
jgi:pimeloyl-ACP methyl ester carboxylesterase